MLLCCICCAERNHGFLQNRLFERHFSSFLQDIPYLVSIIRREYYLFFAQRTLHSRVEEFCEFQIIGYSDQTDLCLLEVSVYSCKIIEHVISLVYELVHLVQNYYRNAPAGIKSVLELCIYLISRPACHRNLFFKMPC